MIAAARPRSLRRRRALWIAVAVIALVVGGAAGGLFEMIRMPGDSFSGARPELTDAERALAVSLRRDVEVLAGEIGERNHEHPAALARAAEWLAAELTLGRPPNRLAFQSAGQTFENLELELPSRAGGGSPEVVVVGAHYDSVVGSPGANDNGTGVAALLALARTFRLRTPGRALRFVAFANEEPPHFQTDAMGSLVYARLCRERGDRVVAMLSLETMGWFDDREGSQKYPAPLSLFYPSRGDFIGFVGDFGSRRLVREAIGLFRRGATIPSEGAALPGVIPGVGWSDHWSFWQEGYPGVMVTDTAPFRYPHYHTAEDTPDKVDYERLARVVTGLVDVVASLADAPG